VAGWLPSTPCVRYRERAENLRKKEGKSGKVVKEPKKVEKEVDRSKR
jgi:hypothetical protein